MPLPRLIYITDRRRLADPGRIIETIEQNLAGGVRAVYWREKDLAAGDSIRQAEAVSKLCKRFSAQLILPGNFVALKKFPDAALQAGQSTPDISRLRRLWGQDRLIGYSAHGVPEAIGHSTADYFFLSPIYPTPSKPEAAALGVNVLRELRGAVTVPVYGLGGITPGNLADVMAAGAHGVAATGALQNQSDLENCRELIRQINAFQPHLKT